MTSLTPTTTPDYREVLIQTALAYRTGETTRTAPAKVVEALLQAEKAAKQQRLSYSLEALLGQWRLCFTTGTRKLRRGGIALGTGFYVPKWVPAYIGFERVVASGQEKAQISNQIQFSGLKLKLTGPAKYLNKKNLLAFDFTQVFVLWGSRSLYAGRFRGGKVMSETFEEQPIAKLPFFSFFSIAEDFIAARGRGGGLALWVREVER
ncbi:MAG: hypothetical protein ACM37W_23030 [Actinomycetota bacterium]